MNGIASLLKFMRLVEEVDGRRFRVTANSRRRCAMLVRKPKWSPRQSVDTVREKISVWNSARRR